MHSQQPFSHAWGIPDRRRRVGRLDWSDVERAIMLNSPSAIAITGFDYAFPDARGVREANALPADAKQFIAAFEDRLGLPVAIVSTGPDVRETVALAERFRKTDDHIGKGAPVRA